VVQTSISRSFPRKRESRAKRKKDLGPRFRGAERKSGNERDCVHMAAIIRLAAMRGTPVAEETRRIGIGAQPEVLDARDLSAFEPRPDEAGQIEHRVTR